MRRRPAAPDRPRSRRAPSLLDRKARRGGKHAVNDGSVLIEALVFMSVIAVTVAAFTISAVSSVHVQRETHGNDIAAEAAHGQIEKAKSVSWNRLAFAPDDDGYRAEFNGHPTVTLASLSDVDRLYPKTSRTIKGTRVHLRTDITWASTPTPTNSGSKHITVTATWTAPGGREREATFSSTRTSHANEAVPTPIPTGFGTPAPPVPTPYTVPEPTATASAGSGWDLGEDW